MIDINLIRNNINFIADNLLKKKYKLNIDYINKLEEERKLIQVKLEELKAFRNNISKEISVLKSKNLNAELLIQKANENSKQQKELENHFNELQLIIQKHLSEIPNLLDKSVHYGVSESDNKEIRKYGIPRSINFLIKDHIELGKSLNNNINFDDAAVISGSRFVFLKDQIAKLHRCLSQFMLDVHTQEHGYIEMYVPYLVNSSAVFGTGQLPKFEDDLFKIMRGDEAFYLIPTAEVPLTNLINDKIIPSIQLPLKYVAHTPCFRSEAGSYGRDTKGLIRMHQFDKVELVQFVRPEESFIALEQLTLHAESILQKLELPYRTILLCSGDTGFSSAKTYDIEVWIPSQQMYREISSCSNMTDFQTRRIRGRYKDESGKNILLHSLNGSGLAVGRALIAVLENYQNEDGTITVPKALVPYMKCDVIK